MMTLTLTNCAKQEIPTHADTTTKMTMDRKALLKDIIGRTGDLRSEGATRRSESTHTIAEAIDLLDEALNYAYCRPGTPLQETLILSDTLIMAVTTSSTVTETELAALFDEASDNIGTQYHALSLTNKQPWVFSVSQFGNLENNKLPIIVQLEVAYGDYITDSIAYSSSDDYSYEYQGGMCDATPGPGAPEVLRTNLKFAHVPYIPSSNKYFFKSYYLWVCNGFSDVQWCDANGLPKNLHDPDLIIYNQSVKSHSNWNNINDFKLFRQHSHITTNYDECLSGDEEMPFNQSEMGSIIQAYNPASLYVPGNIWVGSFKGLILFNDSEVPLHNMIVGYYQVALLDSNDEPIDIPCCN
jgi:hypothetical protein